MSRLVAILGIVALLFAIGTSVASAAPLTHGHVRPASLVSCGLQGTAIRQYREPAYRAGDAAYDNPTQANIDAFVAAVQPIAACNTFPTYNLNQFVRYLFPHFSHTEADYLIDLINAAFGTNYSYT